MAHGSLNALPLGWPEGLARRLPLPPWVVGVAAAAVLFGSYGLGGAVFAGGSGLVSADGDLFYENVLGRMVLVISVLTGYVLAASRYLVRGAHRTLLAARDTELSRLREGIRTERGVLLSAGAAERLPALLALEARVMQVPVWPFDASMRARTAFFVLLPLGSWIGGALVERLLESALR